MSTNQKSFVSFGRNIFYLACSASVLAKPRLSSAAESVKRKRERKKLEEEKKEERNSEKETKKYTNK